MLRVLDNKTGKEEIIKQKTSTSWLITQTKLTDNGINCDNWFDMTLKENKQRFQLL